MANTGAVQQGPCPGCGRAIYGMMPQRCFFCGHDFTEAIRLQNPDFEPDPNYKSMAADATPSEEEVYQDLKNHDRYAKSPYAVAAETLHEEIDKQKTRAEKLQTAVKTILGNFKPDPQLPTHPVVQLVRLVEREFPLARVEAEFREADFIRDVPGQLKVRVEFPADRIVVVETKEVDAPFRPE